MKFTGRRPIVVSIAALALTGAAIPALSQVRVAAKRNVREPAVSSQTIAGASATPAAAPISYSYEFTQPVFFIRHIVVEHDGDGRGNVTFERLDGQEPFIEPLQLSAVARTRIIDLWNSLGFLESDANYQAEKQFPHLGTMKLRMKRDGKERTAEFNWTNDKGVSALVDEYRHAANQAIFIFNITLAQQNQPLEAPKLMDELDRLVTRNELSDSEQLIPLLTDLTTDERIPLIARNHAARILKKLQKKK
jgi:hypothetical protein